MALAKLVEGPHQICPLDAWRGSGAPSIQGGLSDLQLRRKQSRDRESIAGPENNRPLPSKTPVGREGTVVRECTSRVLFPLSFGESMMPGLVPRERLNLPQNEVQPRSATFIRRVTALKSWLSCWGIDSAQPPRSSVLLITSCSGPRVIWYSCLSALHGCPSPRAKYP